MQISSLESTIVIPNNLEEALEQVINKDFKNARIFITVDENTKKHCLPLALKSSVLKNAQVIELPSGEDNKSTESLVKVWDFLTRNKADRDAVLINLGGGLLCDLGGFAASTFKRGIRFINIPTTLLSQVDASVGGKLGINFLGLKNEIGVFKCPDYVIVETEFLKTLDRDNLLSGFGEMIKHALIYSSSHWKTIEQVDLSKENIDIQHFKNMIARSIFIKNDFVQKDPQEKNVRKALNFGHTIGHAFESLLIEQKRPIHHGIAVVHGIVCECYLSHKKLGLSKITFDEILNFILKYYPKIQFEESDYEALFELMLHDKKNSDNKINFTLLSDIGLVKINQARQKEDIFEALDFYRNLKVS